MERIFSKQGYSHIADKIVKNLSLQDLSQLSKASKSLASSTARLWFRIFINKFQLEPKLEELYTSLMSYSESDIQQCLGYIMRIRVEHGIDLKIQPFDYLCLTNCPLALSIFFNQLPLAQLISTKFSTKVEDFSLAIKLVILGDFSVDFLEFLLNQWKEIKPSANRNAMLMFAAENGNGNVAKFQKLLDFGLVPSTEIESNNKTHYFTAMDIAIEKGYMDIVKALLPFYKDLEKLMTHAITIENEELIEILFEHIKVPSSSEMNLVFDKSWKCHWSFYAAMNGKDKAFQKLIILEVENILPPKREEQFLYLSEFIQKGSLFFIKRLVLSVLKTSSL